MREETKTEIVVFTGLAAAALFLWWTNRQNGAGTGLEGLPDALGVDGGNGTLGSPAGLTIPPAATGGTFNYIGAPISLASPPAASPLGATAPASCGCTQPASGGSVTTLRYGADPDLIAALASLPPTQQTFQAAPKQTITAPAVSQGFDIRQAVADMSYGSGSFSGDTTNLARSNANAFNAGLIRSNLWN
jgi:hypothetical protein